MITIEAYEHKPPTEYEWRLLFPSLTANVNEVERLRAENAALRAELAAPKVPAGWQPMESAPKNQLILVAFDGHTRLARYGKTSHIPMYGFCLADQGAEDFDLCTPTHWMPLPEAPKGETE